jgi:hypothetical protein
VISRSFREEDIPSERYEKVDNVRLKLREIFLEFKMKDEDEIRFSM